MMFLAIALAGTAGSAQLVSPSYDLTWHSVDGGGGTSTGRMFEVSGTIGQPEAGGTMVGAGFELAGGFWAGGVTPVPDCPPDIAIPRDGMVNIDDLVLVITQWGQPGGPADINHDNTVNIDDLVAVIIAWGICPQ